MREPSQSPSPSRVLAPGPVLVFVGCLILIWLLLGVLPVVIFEAWDKRGQFGDMFGAVNSLFSALAFAGVIYTILLQREELALQRHELEQTRAELARTAAAQEASERNLAQQASALETTARLNALNAVVEHYRLKRDRVTGVSATREVEEKQATYAAALEAELAQLLASRAA